MVQALQGKVHRGPGITAAAGVPATRRHHLLALWWWLLMCTAPAAAMSFEQVGGDLFAAGPIAAADVEALKQRLAGGGVKRLVLVNSGGGELRAGLLMARQVQAARLTTLVSGHCNSACSLVFMAGQARAFATGHQPRATLVGIHGPSRRDTRELAPLAVPLMLEFYRQRMGAKFQQEVIEPALSALEDHTGMLRVREPQRNRDEDRVPWFCPSSQTPASQCVRHAGQDAISLGVVTQAQTVEISLPESMRVRPAWFGLELAEEGLDDVSRMAAWMPEACRETERCRAGFEAAARRWVAGPFHRAVAVTLDGKGYAFNQGAPSAQQAAQAALYSCNHPAGRTRLCRLLAVDDRVAPPTLDPQLGHAGVPEPRDWPTPAQEALASERATPASVDWNTYRTDLVRLPTPARLEGATVLETADLAERLRQESPPLVIDVATGGSRMIPGAVHLLNGGRALTDAQAEMAFDERFRAVLKAAGATPQAPLVFYGEGFNTWWAFNAARRAVAAGYRQVLWYRGGLEAWMRAGLPTQQKTAVAVLL